MNTTNFSYSEEAFLLNSLHEVVKVWASGKGKADFQLKIKNGTAELQLAFRLGHPSDVHVVPPQHYNPQLPHHDFHQEQQLSAPAVVRDKKDARKIVLEQRNIRLVSSLKNQLNHLIFISLFLEESK